MGGLMEEEVSKQKWKVGEGWVSLRKIGGGSLQYDTVTQEPSEMTITFAAEETRHLRPF